MRKQHARKRSRRKNDVTFEIAFYENVLKEAPDFIEALAALGDLYTKAGYWQKGLEADLKLFTLRPKDPVVLYNLACSYALLNQPRPALNALCKAIEFGYDDFTHLKNDADLENLLKDEHVQAHLKKLEQRKKKSSHETPS